eukprot:SAG31_NODE_748_length_12390_cov_6.306484_18_plen_135_part_00
MSTRLTLCLLSLCCTLMLAGLRYQYRLCKLPGNATPGKPPKEAVTEHCFQQLPLEFDRTKQALLLNNGSRYPLEGVWVDRGTWPVNSTWCEGIETLWIGFSIMGRLTSFVPLGLATRYRDRASTQLARCGRILP